MQLLESCSLVLLYLTALILATMLLCRSNSSLLQSLADSSLQKNQAVLIEMDGGCDLALLPVHSGERLGGCQCKSAHDKQY